MVSGGHISEDPVFCTVDKRALERDRIAVVDRGAAAGTLVQDLVSSGRTILDTRVRIVDPETRRECEPSRVGEVWVAGPTVCQGYWRRRRTHATRFGAPGGRRGRPATGDRGFVPQRRAVRHRPTPRTSSSSGSKSLSTGCRAVVDTLMRCARVRAWRSPSTPGESGLVIVYELERQALNPPSMKSPSHRKGRGGRARSRVFAISLIKTGTVPEHRAESFSGGWPASCSRGELSEVARWTAPALPARRIRRRRVGGASPTAEELAK